MIASIFDADEVADDFRDLIAERTEGNPFVVEEMLREAIERGDVYLADGRWERRAIEEVGIPRDRARDDPAARRPARRRATSTCCAPPPCSAARSPTTRCSSSPTPTRRSCSWRSRRRSARSSSSRSAAPRRATVAARAHAGGGLQRHGAPAAAAPARARRGGARGGRRAAGRGRAAPARARACPSAPCPPASRRPTTPSVRSRSTRRPSCSSACCPYLDELEHARATCRIGRLRWLERQPRGGGAAAARRDRARSRLGAPDEVPGVPARARAGVLGDRRRPTRALREYELAREALEPLGPSADLAMALLRISGMHAFAFEHAPARDAAERAIAVAEAAGAALERTWARAFLAIALDRARRAGAGASS